MQILFIDESGTPPAPDKALNSPLFVLGGAIIPEELWHRVKADLDTLKRKYEVTGEIKWRYFAPAHPDAKKHALSHLSHSDKESLRTSLYDLLKKYKSIRTISIVTDVEAAYQLPYINSADDVYWYSYKQMAERFQYYLQDISQISGQKINGIIVCDHRAPKDDKRLQELHTKLLLGQHNANSSFNHLIEGVFIAPSHLSVGIQLADLVAGAVLRNFKEMDNRFFKQIEETIRKSVTGKIEGYGLIRFPKKVTPCRANPNLQIDAVTAQYDYTNASGKTQANR